MIRSLLAWVSRNNRGDFIDYFANGNFWDGLFEPIFAAMPRPVFAMFVGGVSALGLYSWTESITLPAIVLVLFSGLIIASLPGPAALAATLAVVVVLATGLYYIYAG